MLRARMRGVLLAKAHRGELRIGLPAGLVYDPLDRVVLHPDAQVRDTFHLFFRTGAAGATVRHFSEHHIPFPAPARSNMAAVVPPRERCCTGSPGSWVRGYLGCPGCQ